MRSGAIFASMSQSVLCSTFFSRAKPRLRALPWPRMPRLAMTTRSLAPITRLPTYGAALALDPNRWLPPIATPAAAAPTRVLNSRREMPLGSCLSLSTESSSLKHLPKQRDGTRRLGLQIFRRRLDADSSVVADRTQRREERLVRELAARLRKHAPGRVGHVQVPKMPARSHDDTRILVLAGEVVEVDHQLEIGVVYGLDELETLGGAVNNVGFLAPERLDGNGDAPGPRQRRDALPEVDELPGRLVVGEPFRHAPGGAAAEHDDPDAEFRDAIERPGDIRRLLLAVDRRSRKPDRAGHE